MSRLDPALLERALQALGKPPPAPEPLTAQSFEAFAIATAAALCRRFEGLYLTPYLCPAGVPTIGYGATFYEDGLRVSMRDPAITRQRAEALLVWHLRSVYLPAVLQLCPNVRDPGGLAALADFAFNLGAGQLRASTLRKRVNAGDWAAAPAELRKWVRAGGKVLRGLVLRREAEIEHCPVR